VRIDDVLARHDGKFSLLPAQRLPAPGQGVDWLVLMRRLPARHMLDQRIASWDVTRADVDAQLGVLGPALLHLYKALRAMLRARLGLPHLHLLDPEPRIPDQWPKRARRYIERATTALDAIDSLHVEAPAHGR
jgi:hypothetical protein